MSYNNREGNWMSMDPETAMRGVGSNMTRQELIVTVSNVINYAEKDIVHDRFLGLS